MLTRSVFWGFDAQVAGREQGESAEWDARIRLAY